MSSPIPSPFRYNSNPPPNLRSPSAEEQRIGEIIDAWMGTYKFTKKEEDKYKEALKAALKRYLETSQGKKLKDLLLSTEVLPLTLMVAGTALTALLANEGDIPSIPELELTNKLKVSADIKGNIAKFEGVVITFSLTFGGVDHKVPVKTSDGVIAVSAAVINEIHRQLDDNALRQWIIRQAAWEYEIAGPREESQKLEFRNWVRDPRHHGELPGVHAIADRLAALLVNAAKTKKREVRLELVDERIWSNITDRTGVFAILNNIVKIVAAVLGGAINKVDQVTFMIVPGIKDYTGKARPNTANKLYPIRTKSIQ